MTKDEADRLFLYDPITGAMHWKENMSRRVRAGSKAGTKNHHGYKVIFLNKKNYSVHRIAWLITHGKFPAHQIDHINGVRDDNRIENLRDVNQAENGKNQKLKSNNKSGICGVSWSSQNSKWTAKIRVSGKYINLGYFNEISEAAQARALAESLHGFHSNHGRTGR
jgi:hypothetical protein